MCHVRGGLAHMQRVRIGATATKIKQYLEPEFAKGYDDNANIDCGSGGDSSSQHE